MAVLPSDGSVVLAGEFYGATTFPLGDGEEAHLDSQTAGWLDAFLVRMAP